jgi:uncharacterized membrane protein
MLPRLLTIWEYVRTSLWALPLAMMALAAVVAISATGISIEVGEDPVWFLYSGEAKDAPGFLSNLVTATITLATLAISITMVVLTLAAQQLGPRLIRIFMSDRRTQIMLGLFVATVVYLVLVMRSVYGDSVPNLAVTIGTALVLLSIIVLLIFVHHLARSIIADNVIDDVGAEIDDNARRLLPQKDDQMPICTPPSGPAGDLRFTCEGYIQVVDHTHIVKAACEADAVVELDARSGHLLIAGIAAGRVWPAGAVSEKFTKKVEGGLIVGSERTPVQDLEFSIRQMVEIGVRALSPGVNDPYTALVTIDRLSLSLARIMERGAPHEQWCDDDGHLRLIMPNSHFEGLLDASFNMIRQYGDGSAAVLIRLAERLSDLYALADEKQRKDIRRHLDMIMRAGRRSLPEPDDVAALESRIPQTATG